MSNIIKSYKFGHTNELVAIDRILSNLIGTYGEAALKSGLLKKGVVQLTEEETKASEDNVAEFVAAYNSEGEFASEYALSEDSSHAEFVSDWGYGEGVKFDELKKSEHLSDEVLEAISQLETKGICEDDILNMVLNHCETILTGIYYCDGEVFSASVGEVDHQPSDELLDRYMVLSASEKEEVRNQADCYINGGVCDGWIYTNHDYDRFVSILDEEAFLETVLAEHGIEVAI